MTSRPSLFVLSVLLLAACTRMDANAADEISLEEHPQSQVEIKADPEAESVPRSATEEMRPESDPVAKPVILEAGTEVRFRLSEKVSTETHAAGDFFRGAVIEPVRGPAGVVVPAGTEVIGTVRAADASEGPEDEATLVLTVERIEINGTPTPISATMTDADIRSDQEDSVSETVGKVAVGTAAGAILGRILGSDAGDALKGAAAGTIAGAVVAITTRDGHAVVEEGSLMTIRLEQPVR